MSAEKIVFIKNDRVLKQGHIKSAESVIFDPTQQVYAFYEPGSGRSGSLIIYSLGESFVAHDRSVDLKTPTTMQYLNDPLRLASMRN